MDFTLSESQVEIQNLANKILQEQVTYDSHRALELAKENAEIDEKFDRAAWQHLADAGLLGIAIDEAYGGMSFGFAELSLLLEEAGKVLLPAPIVPAVVAAMTLQQFGAKDLLPGCASGEHFVTAALSENANQGAALLDVKADAGKLIGSKLCVPYANSAKAMLVSAADDQGCSLYLVANDAGGVSSTELVHTTGEPSFEVSFDNTPAIRIGGEEAVTYLYEHYATALCAYQVGVSDTAMRMTASYVGEREQFGVKIGTFQAVGHRAANCFIDVCCLRLVTQQAVSLLNEGRDASTAVCIAKAWAGDAAHRVSYASQHLHGGFGVDRDYGLWRYATHSKWTEITLGGTQFQLAQLGEKIAAGQFSIE